MYYLIILFNTLFYGTSLSFSTNLGSILPLKAHTEKYQILEIVSMSVLLLKYTIYSVYYMFQYILTFIQ